MFKQITTLDGNEWYLIASLWLFILFFLLVGVMLIRMKKDYIDYMGSIPLEDNEGEETSEQPQNQHA